MGENTNCPCHNEKHETKRGRPSDFLSEGSSLVGNSNAHTLNRQCPIMASLTPLIWPKLA